MSVLFPNNFKNYLLEEIRWIPKHQIKYGNSIKELWIIIIKADNSSTTKHRKYRLNNECNVDNKIIFYCNAR